MKSESKKMTTKQTAFLLTLGVHAILLILLFILTINVKFTSAEFAEISFVSQAKETTTPQESAQKEYKPSPPPPPPVVQQQETVESVKKVNLPKRRILEDETPQLFERKNRKLTPEETDQSQSGVQRSDLIKDKKDVKPQDFEQKISITPGTNQSTFENPAIPTTNRGPKAQAQPFIIEGDASNRTIVKQILPQYPSNLQKEAVVKIRFTVTPDGRVTQCLPTRKGDPTLDELTMNALKQWRFNSLPASSTQKNVTGVITFQYKLQ